MSNDQKVLARDYQFHLNTGTSGSPVWVAVNGISSWSPASSAGKADTTTFDNNGRLTHMVASRGDTIGLEGQLLMDEATGDRDPGQEACEAWSTEIGQSSLKQFRITDPAGGTITFSASAVVTGGGGGNDDPSGWNLDMEVSGAITSDTLAAAPDAPGTPTIVAGDDLVTVTWTGSAGTGGHFEVVSVKTSDSSEISRLTSTSPYTFNGLVTATAYKFKVRAINADGVRSAFTALSAEGTTT